ncbi:MAG TPA: nuclear transport factor 2 family protein [Xanthobacteraceae bacterium]|jgi:hypothetical protein
MTASDADDAGLWFALSRLEARCWHDVDFNGGRSAHDLYCADGLFAVGPNRFEGRDSIRTFYEWRRGRGRITTRHVVTNAIVLERDGRRAKASGLLTVYRADGMPPFADALLPVLVADFTSDCLLGDDDAWRYVSHILDPVFVGSHVPPSLSIDPNYLSAARPDGGPRNGG